MSHNKHASHTQADTTLIMDGRKTQGLGGAFEVRWDGALVVEIFRCNRLTAVVCPQKSQKMVMIGNRQLGIEDRKKLKIHTSMNDTVW